MNSSVSSLAGIGPANTNYLNQHGYYTVGQLVEGCKNRNWNSESCISWLLSIGVSRSDYARNCYYDLNHKYGSTSAQSSTPNINLFQSMAVSNQLSLSRNQSISNINVNTKELETIMTEVQKNNHNMVTLIKRLDKKYATPKEDNISARTLKEVDRLLMEVRRNNQTVYEAIKLLNQKESSTEIQNQFESLKVLINQILISESKQFDLLRVFIEAECKKTSDELENINNKLNNETNKENTQIMTMENNINDLKTIILDMKIDQDNQRKFIRIIFGFVIFLSILLVCNVFISLFYKRN